MLLIERAKSAITGKMCFHLSGCMYRNTRTGIIFDYVSVWWDYVSDDDKSYDFIYYGIPITLRPKHFDVRQVHNFH